MRLSSIVQSFFQVEDIDQSLSKECPLKKRRSFYLKAIPLQRLWRGMDTLILAQGNRFEANSVEAIKVSAVHIRAEGQSRPAMIQESGYGVLHEIAFSLAIQV